MIFYFSETDKTFNVLTGALTDYLDSSEKLQGFKGSGGLLQFAKTQAEAEIIILELLSTDNLPLIEELTKISPCSSIMVIADNEISNLIQSKYKKQIFYYLKPDWDKTDLKLALSTAKNTFRLKKELSELNENQEDKIAKRLKNLIDSNEAKDKFISIIAHDLKSPFTGLLGVTELLTDNWDELPDEEKLQLIKDLQTSSAKTLNLLESLLTWSVKQKDKMEVSTSFVEINNVVNSTITLAKQYASQKKIEIQNNLEHSLKITVDENMIATVFRNLISNAIKFTQPGGKINISSARENGYYIFCVADNGKKIDKPSILELFKHQKESQETEKPNGLGLMLCKEFVENNGGRIWLETKKDEGNKFCFTIPVK
ncbi:MAG: HAMP domain-containing sensor histidine kinase [Bacteroidota bacterium]